MAGAGLVLVLIGCISGCNAIIVVGLVFSLLSLMTDD